MALLVLILAYVLIPFSWQVKLLIVVILAVVGHSIGKSSSQNKRFKEGEIKNDYDKKKEEEKQKVQQQSEPESGALNQDRLKPDPGALDPSGKTKTSSRQYPRQKRENVDYKLVNEKLDEPVRSYILPKDSWGLLDGPSVLKH